MTYIEFFDPTAAENICASLTNPPERVILIGDRRKLLAKHAQRYQELFLARGHEVEFICRSINKNNMENIVQELTQLVETYPDCVFDLTGGEDLYLVAMGIVAERYRDRNIQMHRFNIYNGTIIDCDQDGKTIMEREAPHMTVEENVRAYGCNVVYDTLKPIGTHLWEMSEAFKADIAAMWSLCRQDVRLWNRHIGALATALDQGAASEDELSVTIPAEALLEGLRRFGCRQDRFGALLEALREANLLSDLESNAHTLDISFKNRQVKRCLTKAGQVLEMVIYGAALEAEDKDGLRVYDDVMNGVCIDWDGLVHTEADGYDTENEIDVMMMHGIVPVFVSCKNGGVDIDELYKLSAVAQRVGGRYAKKVLVATALGSASTADEHFRQRAMDMNIRLVEGVQEMSSEELNRVVRSFWSN